MMMIMKQFIVRFQDQSRVLTVPDQEDNQHASSIATITPWLLQRLGEETGWPVDRLRVSQFQPPFVQITVKSALLGGKGGFGTLLKGQSRQKGAKLTTDFGACRDLQGRRLRHVNDELKLRKWKDMQRREQAGEKVDAEELWNTPSGLYNWHLMTPTWADISKKATHQIKRQFHKMDQQAQKQAMLKKERDELHQKTMAHYLEQATQATGQIQESIGDAIQQGLATASTNQNKHKRKRGHIEPLVMEDAEPNSLVTLSGDIVMEESSCDSKCGSSSIELQSKSDFGTAILVLNRSDSDEQRVIYYEVTLVTGGMAQIGWASLWGDEVPVFAPNNEAGDGVGDDAASFAVDGSRRLKFHASKEEEYGLSWKAGDRLGCWVDRQKGTIGFSINGKDCGEAFSFDGTSIDLVPAFSCNQGEILKLHTQQNDCKYFVENAVAIGDLLNAGKKDDKSTSKSVASATRSQEESGKKPAPTNAKQEENLSLSSSMTTAPATETKEEIKAEQLDLEPYQSAQELEALGLDRLKSALMALQVKCGGSLKERAERLFCLKGLDRNDYPTKVRAKNFQE